MLMAVSRSRSNSNASQDTSQVTAYAEDGHSTSGRTTPEQRRRATKVATSSLLASDAKYKKFAAQVDRSLQSFDNVNEWADFISFLSRLLKTLQTPSPPYSEIPRKLIVSKRLAQCLNPALPSGVHQRAFDVYSHIFLSIGTEGLKRDLLIWSSGLFPFFQFAATSVRPLLLNMYERYYLPLQDGLRPATKAMILALLPGMEEETGDFFDRVLALLDQLSSAVTPAFFFQTLFLILISSSSSRLAALNYLARRMLKPPAQELLDSGLILRGVAAVLEDGNVLVRRQGLDLLLRVITLDGTVMKTADERDQELLVRSATSIVLQRDISLSRRVYSWLLGAGETPSEQVDYFRQHGLDLLCRTLLADMTATSARALELKPFKIFLSLLDRWEIGSPLSERLVIPALQQLRRMGCGSPDLNVTEVITTASAVYEGVEPTMTWHLLSKGIAEHDSTIEELLQWILHSIPQNDQEVNDIHASFLLHAIVDDLMTVEIPSLKRLTLAAKLLNIIPPALMVQASSAEGNAAQIEIDLMNNKTSMDEARGLVASTIIPQSVSKIFQLSHRILTESDQTPRLMTEILDMISLLVDRDLPLLSTLDSSSWLDDLLAALSRTTAFQVVDRIIVLALKASTSSAFRPKINVAESRAMSCLLDALFRYLKSEAALYHVRAVELLWECNQRAEIHTLENVIARRMSSPIRRAEAFDAFGVLWRLSDDSILPGDMFYVPLCTLLETLNSLDPNMQQTAETWLRCNLQSYFRALDPLLARLIDAVESKDQDLSMMLHILGNVAAFFRFGGHGLSKACQTTALHTSTHPGILKRAISAHKVQSASLDILQQLVSRGDVSSTLQSQLKDCLIEQLGQAVKRRRLALQNKMLHLLHMTLNTSSDSIRTHQHTPSNADRPQMPTEFDISLVRVITEALASPTNRSVVQHWVDFVLLTTPQFQKSRQLVLAMCDTFSQQVKASALQLRQYYSRTSTWERVNILTDSEPTMLLSALEKLLAISLGSSSPGKADDNAHTGEGGSRILGLVSGVFTVEAPAISSSKERMDYIDDAIEALLVLWAITADPSSDGPEGPSRVDVFTKVRARAKKVLERLFKMQPSAVMRSCVNVWAVASNDVSDGAIFECVDALTPSAQKVVELVSEIVNGKASRSSTAEQQPDPAVLAFLEAYVSRLEAPIAVQVWSTMFTFGRELLGSLSSPSTRPQLFPAFRCLTLLGKTVSTTSALEDRRLRRDLHDVYTKLLDAVASNASRIAETGVWERGILTEKSIPNGVVMTSSESALKAIYTFVAKEVIPSLRVLLVDSDRVNTACTNLSSSILVPAFKQQRVDTSMLQIVFEMTKIPATGKAWRTQVGDTFNDNRFFSMSFSDSNDWKPIICSLFDSDKERFGDLLGRITAVPSANIFTNREQETIAKALNLRRLSFILLAAERDHYLLTLPSIQEKLVEILRSNGIPARVESEVWLCLRVMMCRISPQHLTNFWPVILTELVSVFESTMDDPPPDESDQLQLVLSACKFLDLLLVIQSEDFQIHQWMFVTDTTDAAFPPSNYDTEAMMDRLAEIINEHSHSQSHFSSSMEKISSSLSMEDSTLTLRRPRLAGVKTLTSLNQLKEFFARASLDTFESVYNNMGVDWDAVEEGLAKEIFS
ncbi:hypothetical protein TREMEDRAFT_71761 [Tremella mesenterica DSM 1558]|uniref:uncharacterized protein n=1 Tax=Tremella mesenterica (strain ATCC 24925 / CBS 8224 / DSM 1558 / NBRC 9311 / NRRL Y-6157 / RJB 2259-6 / UBC 559-6) TaxID=578456 RepID=UPI0003F4A507|nr:uncharacterized protein TREMEDRAFT_71761 [Tremella mesenterica DSM 1558]EIW69034.1 hypothetical protein TREMEDRAFT_71761 [Tremella mesenterica DSM 1558]